MAIIGRNIFQTGDQGFYNWTPEGSRDSDDFVPGHTLKKNMRQ